MEYKKVIFTVDPNSEINRDILTAKLGEIGFDSFTDTEATVEVYIPANQFSEESLSTAYFSDYPFFSFKYTIDTIPDQNWNEVWEKNYFKPLQIGAECLIRAPFHNEYPKTLYEIIIEPRMAFGTGNHETTYLMISEILKLNLNGKTVLDMGCGTGVLAILASLKGAKEVVAIDIDENAYQSTLENTKYNNITNVKVICGGAEQLNDSNFDVIFANIQRNILLQDIPEYSRVMNPEGILIMSGFYKDDLFIIQQRAGSYAFNLSTYQEKNNWIAATFIFKQ